MMHAYCMYSCSTHTYSMFSCYYNVDFLLYSVQHVSVVDVDIRRLPRLPKASRTVQPTVTV